MKNWISGLMLVAALAIVGCGQKTAVTPEELKAAEQNVAAQPEKLDAAGLSVEADGSLTEEGTTMTPEQRDAALKQIYTTIGGFLEKYKSVPESVLGAIGKTPTQWGILVSFYSNLYSNLGKIASK